MGNCVPESFIAGVTEIRSRKKYNKPGSGQLRLIVLRTKPYFAVPKMRFRRKYIKLDAGELCLIVLRTKPYFVVPKIRFRGTVPHWILESCV